MNKMNIVEVKVGVSFVDVNMEEVVCDGDSLGVVKDELKDDDDGDMGMS